MLNSTVRYEPGARFSAHDHPLGEEILVLEGVFSMKPAITPQAHTFATRRISPRAIQQRRLRAAGETWHQFQATTHSTWLSIPTANLHPGTGNLQVLSLHHHGSEQVAPVRWPVGERLTVRHSGGEEIYVISGELKDEHGTLPRGHVDSQPAYEPAPAVCREGDADLVKVGHLPVVETLNS